MGGAAHAAIRAVASRAAQMAAKVAEAIELQVSVERILRGHGKVLHLAYAGAHNLKGQVGRPTKLLADSARVT